MQRVLRELDLLKSKWSNGAAGVYLLDGAGGGGAGRKAF
jgi:hypothetical protein